MFGQVVVWEPLFRPGQDLPEDKSAGIDVDFLSVTGIGAPELRGLPVGGAALSVHRCVSFGPDSCKSKVVDFCPVVSRDLSEENETKRVSWCPESK